MEYNPGDKVDKPVAQELEMNPMAEYFGDVAAHYLNCMEDLVGPDDEESNHGRSASMFSQVPFKDVYADMLGQVSPNLMGELRGGLSDPFVSLLPKSLVPRSGTAVDMDALFRTPSTC